MKWLEKNWLVVAIVIVAYLYFNGSLSNLLGGTSSSVAPASGTAILGG